MMADGKGTTVLDTTSICIGIAVVSSVQADIADNILESADTKPTLAPGTMTICP
jgi:hypothetical protein